MIETESGKPGSFSYFNTNYILICVLNEHNLILFPCFYIFEVAIIERCDMIKEVVESDQKQPLAFVQVVQFQALIGAVGCQGLPLDRC